jgi:hypothetical protein
MSAVKQQNPAAEKEAENFHVLPKDGKQAPKSSSDAAQADVLLRDPEAGTITTDPAGEQVNSPARRVDPQRSQVS